MNGLSSHEQQNNDLNTKPQLLEFNGEHSYKDPAFTWHQVHYHHLPQAETFNARTKQYHSDAHHATYINHSRANRKHRYVEYQPDMQYWKKYVIVPPLPRLIAFDVNNISWWVAMFFTIGSVAWVVNGQYAMWPESNPTTNENILGYSALVGGLLFWMGAYLAVVESLNEPPCLGPEYFGFEVEHILHRLSEQPKDVQLYVERVYGKVEEKFTDEQDRDLYRHAVIKLRAHDSKSSDGGDTTPSAKQQDWRWVGTETRSVGWWASIIQFIGATCFTISVIAGVPGVIGAEQWQLQFAFEWSMQVIGSLGFIISALLCLLEKQDEWYKPALDRIGWQSQFWNLIGALGFFFSAVFGYLSNWRGQGTVCCQFWGTAFNTYYGSWAFLISSYLMLLEVQNKQMLPLRVYWDRVVAWGLYKVDWCGGGGDKRQFGGAEKQKGSEGDGERIVMQPPV